MIALPTTAWLRRLALLGVCWVAWTPASASAAALAPRDEAATTATQAPTLGRLSFWVPEERMAEFAEAFHDHIRQWFLDEGMVEYDEPGRPTIPGVFTQIYRFDSPAQLEGVQHAFRGRLDILRRLQDLGGRFGSDRDDGLIRTSFSLYEAPFEGFRTVTAGPGSTRALGPGRGRWRMYDVTDGLVGPMVLSLLQDGAGHMWFGTQNNGVSRFDGQRWVSYTVDDGLPSNRVQRLVLDAEGRIWFATNKGAAYLEDDRIVPFAPGGKPLEGDVRAIAHGEDGIWLAVFGRGIVHVVGDSLHWADHDDGLLDDRVTCLLPTHDGDVWVGSYAGLNRLTGGVWRSYTEKEGLPDGAPADLLEAADGSLWVSVHSGDPEHPGGVARFDGDGWTVYGRDDAPVLARPMRLYQDPDGDLWVGAADGVAHLCDGTWTELEPDEGRDLRSIYQLLRDREGYLWLATMVGVGRYDDQSMSVYTQRDGVPPGAWSMRRADDGDLWIAHGTWPRGVTRLRGGELFTLTAADGLPDNHVYSTYEDPQGGTWLSTGAGAARYDEAAGTIQIFDTVKGLPYKHCSSVLRDRQGRLWFGTPLGVARVDSGRVEVFGAADGVSPGEVQGLYQARDGDLWILTTMGVTRYDGETFEAFDVEAGLAHDEVFGVAEDEAGRLWFATHGGVGIYDHGTFTSYTAADGLTSNDVHSIALVEGGAWIGTDGGGVSRFDGRVFQSITAADGLPDNVVLSVAPAGDGSFWLGSEGGLVRYRPRPVDDVPVSLNAVVADRRYTGDDAVGIPSTVDVVAFEFGAVSLKTRPGQTVFCYRLVGHDDTWRHTRDMRIEYHGLPRGDYTFEVQAVDRDLSYSTTPARLHLRVHLPYERIAWLSVLVVAVGLVAWQGTRVVRRDQRLRESNRQLADKTDELEVKTHQLEENTRALERAHQEVLQASQAKSAFLANVSHELRTPLNAIINFSALILDEVYGDVSEDLRDAVEEIDRNGESLLALINDVLDLSKIEAGAMQLQFSECAPSACVETAVTAMQHKAHSKGLSLEGEVADELPTLWADERRLTQQVLVNLVDNAIKFTAQGGVRVGAAADNGDVHFWVADTGPGIDARERERVFQPFYQSDGSPTRAAGGTGLGLAIVRRFVELHGGAVWLESEAGRGSTFHIKIPHRETPAPS